MCQTEEITSRFAEVPLEQQHWITVKSQLIEALQETFSYMNTTSKGNGPPLS